MGRSLEIWAALQLRTSDTDPPSVVRASTYIRESTLPNNKSGHNIARVSTYGRVFSLTNTYVHNVACASAHIRESTLPNKKYEHNVARASAYIRESTLRNIRPCTRSVV